MVVSASPPLKLVSAARAGLKHCDRLPCGAPAFDAKASSPEVDPAATSCQNNTAAVMSLTAPVPNGGITQPDHVSSMIAVTAEYWGHATDGCRIAGV